MLSPRRLALSSSTSLNCSCRRRSAEALVFGAAAAEADLGEARALAHDDAEGARHDLGIDHALIARLDLVEGAAAIDDQPGEDVEAAGRAFGIYRSGNAGAELKALQQRHDIDAVFFQDRAVAQVDFMQGELA